MQYQYIRLNLKVKVFLTNVWSKENSRKSVRWSAVPVAPKLVYVRCGSERGSGPEGADDLCWARI